MIDMKKLMEMKKNKDKLDPMYKDAKMGSLQQLKDVASQMMGDDVKGMKKVSVMAPDEAHLKEGLDKAKQMLSGEPQKKEQGLDEKSIAEQPGQDDPGEDEDLEALAGLGDDSMDEDDKDGEHAVPPGNGDSLSADEEAMLKQLLLKKAGNR